MAVIAFKRGDSPLEDKMPYIRISVMQPRQERRSELEDLSEGLLRQLKGRPGFIDGYLMMTTDGTGRVGRVTLWKSRKHADRAALAEDVLVTRSEMEQLIEKEEDLRLEQGFESIRA
jgi:hypothetical protein